MRARIGIFLDLTTLPELLLLAYARLPTLSLQTLATVRALMKFDSKITSFDQAVQSGTNLFSMGVILQA